MATFVPWQAPLPTHPSTSPSPDSPLPPPRHGHHHSHTPPTRVSLLPCPPPHLPPPSSPGSVKYCDTIRRYRYSLCSLALLRLRGWSVCEPLLQFMPALPRKWRVPTDVKISRATAICLNFACADSCSFPPQGRDRSARGKTGKKSVQLLILH